MFVLRGSNLESSFSPQYLRLVTRFYFKNVAESSKSLKKLGYVFSLIHVSNMGFDVIASQRVLQIHMKHGALFGSKNGFERPAYYVIDDAGKPQTDLDVLPYDYYGCYDNEKHPSYPYCDEVLKDCTYQFPPKSHRLVGECQTMDLHY